MKTQSPTLMPQGTLSLRPDLRIHRRSTEFGTEYWFSDPITGETIRTDEDAYRRLSSVAEADEVSDAIDHEARILGSRHGLFRGKAATSAMNRPGRRWWQSPLYIRFPGIGANSIARRLSQYAGPFFARPAVMVWLGFLALTAIAVLLNWQKLASDIWKLPQFQAQYWWAALSVLALTKVAHELAHAVSCDRAGARCKEIGLLLLCGTPCLYCDVSDSWRVASVRRRMAIMAAGVYVEWILAACAFWMWYATGSPWVRALSMHVMFVCGVSTFIFNANPLMKYDGYFVLADWLHLANLRSQARAAFQRTLIEPWALRAAHRSPRRFRNLKQIGLSVYHLASTMYRWLVVLGLATWFYWVTDQLGMEPLARIMLWSVGVMIGISFMKKAMRILTGHGFWQNVNPFKRVTLIGVIVCTCLAVLFVPVNRRVLCSGKVDLSEASEVYAPLATTIDAAAIVRGSRVDKDDVLFRLDDRDLQQQLLQSQTRLALAQSRLAMTEKLAVTRPELTSRFKSLTTDVERAQLECQQAEKMIRQCQVRSPISGIVFLSGSSGDVSRSLRPFSDWIGQAVETGQTLCRVGDPSRKRVTLTVEAESRHAIQVGMPVRLRLLHSSSVVTCEIEAIEYSSHNRTGPTGSFLDRAPSPRFEVVCNLPSEVAASVPVGTQVDAVALGEVTNGLTLLRTWLFGEGHG